MKKHGKILKAICGVFAAMIVAASVSFASGNANYNDFTYRKYENLSQNSSIPNLFSNDSVFGAYKSYPPVIHDGLEYVPLELFYSLPKIKVSFSGDNNNFYIQNKNTNKYISFSIDGGYAVTDANKVHETKVLICYGAYYVPLRVVCASTDIGCDSYNDGENKIYVIKVYVTSGLSAKELIKIHAPGIYGSTTTSPTQPDVSGDNPSVSTDENQSGTNTDGDGNTASSGTTGTGTGLSGGEANADSGKQENEKQEPEVENFGRRTLHLSYVGAGLKDAPRILDMLSACGIKAAFFVTAEEIFEYPDTVRRIYTDGHTIGITFAEDAETLSATGALEQYITEAEDALYEVLKTKTRLVYLPEDNAKVYSEADVNGRTQALGLRIIGFNLDANADVWGYAASGARLTDSIKNLETVQRTTNAYIKLTFSEHSRLVTSTLATLSAKHAGVVFGQITEVN